VHERACELEATLHATRQAARSSSTDVPEVDELQCLANASSTRAEQHAEERRVEIDVLLAGQIRE
jgi:hypothetical protein